MIVTNYTIGHSGNSRINSLFTNVMMKLTLAMLLLKVMPVFEGRPKKMPKYPPSLRKHGTSMETGNPVFPLKIHQVQGCMKKTLGREGCKQPVIFFGGGDF